MDNENNNNNEESIETSNNNENENLPREYDQAAERRNKIIGFLIIVAIIVAIKYLSGN